MKETSKSEPIGFCVYCGVTAEALAAKGQLLTSEHVLPEGLGGVQELVSASCHNCALETHRFEGHCLRDIFGPIRAYLGAYGSQSDKPESLPVYFVNEDGSKEKSFVPTNEYPFYVAMPLMPPPGILGGRDRNAGYAVADFSMKIWRSPGAAERCALLTERDARHREVETRATGSIGQLCRFLAKIAHCLALYGYGDGVNASITPFLQDLIIGRTSADHEGPYFVGGASFASAQIESISFDERFPHFARTFELKLEGVSYLVARIQLFAYQEMPVYEVVIGQIEWPPTR